MSLFPPAGPPERDVHTPSTLARFVRDLLEDALPLIWIEGEVSSCSRPASGHLYFNLKDGQAQVRCAMFRSRAQLLRFRPADGARVLARARVSLYEARGDYQLVLDHMEEAGEGALLRAFEQLKARLAAEGLFDAARKRPLPTLARRIAVITSPSGAAIRDVLSVVARRFPLARIELLPVPVQGREAAPAIVAMIAAASRARRHDVLLLTRGGGSIEDLWAFNDEALARAIRASAIPVISAVGHEIDFTIADFAADLRAPTPSAAAELLVPNAEELRRRLERDRRQLGACMQRVLRTHAQRLDRVHARLLPRHPRARVRSGRQRLLALRSRLRLRNPALRVREDRRRLRALSQRLHRIAAACLQRSQAQTQELGRALAAVGPLATLQRGYAIVIDASTGRVVRSGAQAPGGALLRVRVADGDFDVRVERDR